MHDPSHVGNWYRVKNYVIFSEIIKSRSGRLDQHMVVSTNKNFCIHISIYLTNKEEYRYLVVLHLRHDHLITSYWATFFTVAISREVELIQCLGGRLDQHLLYRDSGFQMAGIQDSDFKKGWDSGFRFQMAGIQYSDYVFQGHIIRSCDLSLALAV